MFRNSAQVLLVILLLMGHLISLGGLPGMSVLLCYKADGRVAIEPVCKRVCTTPGDNEVINAADSERDEVYAGDASCIDIPFILKVKSAPSPRHSEEWIDIFKSVDMPVLIVHAGVSESDVKASTSLHLPITSNDPRAVLSTIILLV